MTISPEYGAAFTALGSAIAWLVKELVSRKKEYDTALGERQKLHDTQITNLQKAHESHAGDLKDQLKAYREQVERHQEFYESSQQEARIQERASMTVLAGVSERMATLSAVIVRDSK